MKNKLERVNGFPKEVYIIEHVAIENDANKRQRLIDGSFSVLLVEIVVAVEGAAAMEDTSKFPEIEVTEGDPAILSVGSSRVSGLGAIVMMSSSRKASAILWELDLNLHIFSRSWVLQMEMWLKLRTSPLSVLTVVELHQLREILRSGWQEEIQVHKDDGQTFSPTVWVTLAMR